MFVLLLRFQRVLSLNFVVEHIRLSVVHRTQQQNIKDQNFLTILNLVIVETRYQNMYVLNCNSSSKHVVKQTTNKRT